MKRRDFFERSLLAGAVPVPLYPPVRLGRLAEYHVATARMIAAVSARLVLADAATRSCVNRVRIRPLTSRSDEAQSSSVVPIDAPVIHDLQIMVTQGFRYPKNPQL